MHPASFCVPRDIALPAFKPLRLSVQALRYKKWHLRRQSYPPCASPCGRRSLPWRVRDTTGLTAILASRPSRSAYRGSFEKLTCEILPFSISLTYSWYSSGRPTRCACVRPMAHKFHHPIEHGGLDHSRYPSRAPPRGAALNPRAPPQPSLLWNSSLSSPQPLGKQLAA